MTAIALLFASSLVLAERGSPACCSIVVESSAPSARTAAAELSEYIEKSTGVTLPVRMQSNGEGLALPGSRTASEATIRVLVTEDPSLGDDGFRLAASAGTLSISGGKRGVLYGAHEVLRRFAGVEWFSSWCEDVPLRSIIEVPADFSLDEKPAFPVRELFWADILGDARFAAHMRINNRTRRKSDTRFGGTDACRFDDVLSNAHTFRKIIPESLFAEHPEYFSEIAGKRVGVGAQLCLSNPEVLRIAQAKVLERMAANPAVQCFGVGQNDWYNWCRCDRCRAVDDAEGSPAGSIVMFVNAIAATVRERHPGKFVETLAYQYSRTPPRTLRPLDNVMICLCTIECEFANPLAKSRYGQNVKFVEDMRGWAERTKTLFIWDYTTNFREYLVPFPNLRALQPNLQFFRDNGVYYMFEQGNNLGHHAEFAELKTWLLAKWMWNPDIPEDVLVRRFLNGYYGAASRIVGDYLAELHSAARETPPAPMQIDALPSTVRAGLPVGFFRKWSDRFDAAEKAVADDSARLYNVKTTRLPLDYMMLSESGKNVYVSENDCVAEEASEMRKVATRLLAAFALAQSNGRRVRLSERPRLENDRMRLLKSIASGKGMVVGSNGSVTLQEDAFVRSGPPGVVTPVEDALASDGKSIRLENNNCGWYSNFDMNRVAFRPGRRYTVSVRLRVDKTGLDGEACSAGIYDTAGRKSVCAVSLAARDVSSGFAEYALPAFTPGADYTLYVAPGLFDTEKAAASPVHNGVYVDSFTITEN